MARLLRLTVVALMLVLWMGPHTVAHADQSVDLSALHPQPSDLFEPGEISSLTCQATGNGTICQGTGSNTFGPFPLASCSGFDIKLSGSQTEVFTLFYDENGNLTKLIRHYMVSGQVVNSITGTSLPFTQNATETDAFSNPGDFDTATVTYTGKAFQLLLPGGGVFQGVGILVYGPEGILKVGGPHPFVTGNVASLCAALAGA